MRWSAAVLMLAFAACSDAHPAEVVGTWVSDRPVGSSTRLVDTLELARGGNGRMHRLVYSYPDDISSTRVDTALNAGESRPLTWTIVRNDDGRHLCLADVADAKNKLCQPLHVVPETELSWGDERYAMRR